MTKRTLVQIKAEMAKLQQEADEVIKQEFDSVLAEVKEKISNYGLTAEQLGLSTPVAKKGAKKAAAKDSTVMYKNGELTWSGAARGRKPDWVKEILDAGGDIEKYRVK